MDGNTAILLIDPYNDFLHPSGKANAGIRDSLEKTNTISNIHKLLKIARSKRIPVFYCLHQQSHPHAMVGWKHFTKSLASIKAGEIFEAGSWGVEYYEGMAPDFENRDVVVSKHWTSSSFQNTDLDFQLKQRDIQNVILAGLVANTCVEATARYAYELMYDVTMLHDCTAGFSHDGKVAAENMIWPQFANSVTTVDEWAKTV